MEAGSKERDRVVFILREIYGKLVTSVVNEPSKKKKRPGVTATQNSPDEDKDADRKKILNDGEDEFVYYSVVPPKLLVENATGKKTLDDEADEFVGYSLVPPKLQVRDKVNLLSSQTREVKSNLTDLKQGGQTLTLKLDVIQVTLEAVTVEANHLWGRFGAVSREVGEVARMVNVIRVKIDAVRENLKVIGADGELVQEKIEAVEEEIAQVRNVTEKMEEVEEIAQVRNVMEKMEEVEEIAQVTNVAENLEEVEEIAQVRNVTEKMEEVEDIAQVRKVTEKMEEVEEMAQVRNVTERMAEVGNATECNETSDVRVCATVEHPAVHEKDSGFGREVDIPERNEQLDDHDRRLVDQKKEKWKAEYTKSVELGEIRQTRETDEDKQKNKRRAVDTKAGVLGEKKEGRTTVSTISGEHGEVIEKKKMDESKEKWQRERTAAYTKTGKLDEMKEFMTTVGTISGEHGEVKEKRKMDESKEKLQRERTAASTKTGKLSEMKEKAKRMRKTEEELSEMDDAAEVSEDNLDFLTGMECNSDDGDTNDSLGFMGDVRTRKKTEVTKNSDRVRECDEVGIIDKFLDDSDKVDEIGDGFCEEWNRESKRDMEVYGAFEKCLESEELSDDCNDEIVDDFFEERETAGVSEGLDEIRDEIVKIYVEIGEITKDIEEFKTGVKSSESTDIHKIIRKHKPHPTTKCVCDECGKVLSCESSLRRHKKWHTRQPNMKKPKVEHRCPVCGKLCLEKHNLRVHMKTHAHIPVECERCGQVCRTQNKYIYHMTTHGVLPEGGELNLCDVCGKVFSTPPLLARHRRLHFKPRVLNFKCLYCSRRFNSQNHLDEHVAMHTGKRDVCEVCGKSYRSKIALRKHQVSHLPEKRFHCEICHKRFSTHGSYKQHLNIHITKVQCSVCPKTLSNAGNLKKHMNTHRQSQSREYVTCDICHKQYASKETLRFHQQLIHQKQTSQTNNTGRETVNVITPINCDICNKTFPALLNLKHHMRTHLKNMKCQICGKAFSTKQLLNFHMVSHTGEKNFPCDDCGKRFGHPGNLIRHKRVIHSDSDGQTFECHVCCKSFKCIPYLKAHIKTHNKTK